MSTTIRFQNRLLVVGDQLMSKTLDLAKRAAKTEAPVLLCGESGTGKELIARFIHDLSPRRSNAFVSVNCAAIPEGLMEAELFGYERGAFTGAVNQRIGKFERADKGTLLLDEVSEMPTALQAKLLRVLQESEIDRLGGKEPITIDSRVIATTNRDPLRLIEEEKFRGDLYYRLNVIRIECPPLRGRAEAIEGLSHFFLEQACERYGRDSMKFMDCAMKKLTEYLWPGNVRELSNAIERAVVSTDGDKLAGEHLDFFGGAAFTGEVSGASLADLEEKHIEQILQETGGNRTEAAKKLGISIRTLRNRLRDYRAA